MISVADDQATQAVPAWSSAAVITTAAADQASGATEAGRPFQSTFSGIEPDAVRWASIHRSQPTAPCRSPFAASVIAAVAVMLVQLIPSRRHDPPGARPPAGRCSRWGTV